MQANSDVQPPPSSPTTTTTTTTTTPTRPVRSRRSTTTTSTQNSSSSSSSSSRKKSSSTSSTSTKLEPRTRDTIIVKPIIYGNIAFHLGKKADITKTHKWTCYLRGIGRRRNFPQQNQQQQHNENINQQQQNENNNNNSTVIDENDEMLFDDDLSYIRKVVFTLHESFPDPIREVNSPPWEISEQGWGEFDIPIKIYFKDPSEKPITIVHSLTLFPKMIISPKKSENYTEQQQLLGGPIVQNLAPKKVLVTEHYEELLFVNPRPQFYQILLSSAPNSANSSYNSNTGSSSSSSSTGGNVGEIVLAESEMPAAKKRRKNSKVTTSSSTGGGNCLTHQSQIEAYAPKMDEKKDVELLVRTCRALDAKIRELNMELARKMEQQVSLAAPPPSSSSSLSSSSHAS